ncbi:MAG TPA: [acyl-carrier-protein] S-malonyltransferase, partial [Tenacibaculum sp.]|nr:[acyl-carrier-protein] S-malonyltransferase [Tenacibaculum sp.]
VVAEAVIAPKKIKENLISQLTAPVKWTQSIQNMIADGGSEFVEVGPGKVLQGLMRKINRSISASSVTF